MTNSKHVVVLGAGMCGLYAARKLAQAGVRVTVLEKMDRVGGLAASMTRDGVNFDLGVKHLHAHDADIFQDIQSLMGADLLPVRLRAKVKFGDRFRRYPLKLADLLLGIPPWRILWLFGGLSLQQLKNNFRRRDPANAEEALIQLYGGPLYRYFFREFTHRYWGIPPTRLSAQFVSRKMPRLGAVDLLRKLLVKIGLRARYDTEVENALAEETLYYSKDGAIAIPRRLAETIQQDGGQVVTSATITSIKWRGDRVRGVCYDGPDGPQSIACDHVINTIPIVSLIRLLGATVPADVRDAAARLQHRPLVVYGLLVNKPTVLDALYVYYRNCMFHRIAEPSQSGLDTGPEGHAALLVEVTCVMGDDVWNDAPSARDRLLADLAAEDVVTADEIVAIHHQRSAFGYPIFALGFEQHHQRVQAFFDTITNFDSIGRQGGFCYPNMHETMQQGANVAQRLIEATA
ncbi:MAG: FAD-dependent oxidoreductase [Planctomycetota bacterium]|nr:FAD-dependent oxidoreductase [Planctomycetota bacterium]